MLILCKKCIRYKDKLGYSFYVSGETDNIDAVCEECEDEKATLYKVLDSDDFLLISY